MDPLRVLTAEAGFFTTKEAKSAGYGDRDIARMVRQRQWLRLRRGAYVFPDEWALLDEVGRHRIRSSVILRSHGDGVALSHVSGVIRHGIDVWGLPLDRVHVTRLDGGPGRIERDVVHHEGFVGDEEVRVTADGQRVLVPERCVLEAASRADNEVALCLMDSGLRAGAFSQEQLEAAFAAMQHWPFVRHLHIPVRMADGRSGSVGETRGRWVFRALGIPAPRLQFEVRGPDGAIIGITDWWWEQYRLLGEFDGRVKYGRSLNQGKEPGDVVFAEKLREDRLRDQDLAVVRWTWADRAYFTPVADRIRSRLARSAARRSPR
jgi:hypothetical protein